MPEILLNLCTGRISPQFNTAVKAESKLERRQLVDPPTPQVVWSSATPRRELKFDDSESSHPLTGNSAYLSEFTLWPAEQKAEGGTNVARSHSFIHWFLSAVDVWEVGGCAYIDLKIIHSRPQFTVESELRTTNIISDICHGAGCSERQNEDKDKMIKTREELASVRAAGIILEVSTSIYAQVRQNLAGKPSGKNPVGGKSYRDYMKCAILISGGRSLGSYQGSLTPEFQVELCSLMFQSNLIGCAETSIEIQTNYWPWVKWGLGWYQIQYYSVMFCPCPNSDGLGSNIIDALGLRENGSNTVLLSPIGSLSFHANQLLNYQNRLNATSSTPTGSMRQKRVTKSDFGRDSWGQKRVTRGALEQPGKKTGNEGGSKVGFELKTTMSQPARRALVTTHPTELHSIHSNFTSDHL
ncbi:hypothetical protein K438DRAFT_1770435 [Mycena galopus ATCC 62051]|nr:hypothetical protein K438DRAFT_1770435 [Mycena galopus ATCC 62051]